jgi:hypothetical protein
VKRDILDDPVALVEDSEHRDALRHRSDSGLVRHRRRLARLGRGLVLLLGAATAASERKQEQQRCGEPAHAYSGIHGS